MYMPIYCIKLSSNLKKNKKKCCFIKKIYNFADCNTKLVDMYQEKNSRKNELVRNEIILQAQKLFKQYSLKKTTMDEIAVACGKAKSTLYHYFKSKEEVFDAVIDKESTSLRHIVSIEVNKHSSLKDKLQTYFITFHKETIQKINLYRILKQELKAELSNQERFGYILDFEILFVESLITKGIENGELTGITKENTHWFSELLVVAFLGIVIYSVTKDDELDLDELYKVSEVIISRLII